MLLKCFRRNSNIRNLLLSVLLQVDLWPLSIYTVTLFQYYLIGLYLRILVDLDARYFLCTLAIVCSLLSGFIILFTLTVQNAFSVVMDVNRHRVFLDEKKNNVQSS